MDLTEFDALAEGLRGRSAASQANYGFALIDGRVARDAEIADVEQRMGVTLPTNYKTFTRNYGGGMFGFVDLLAIVAEPDGREDDLVTVNDRQFPDRDFVAVAPVGTGDYWCFPVTEGRCRDEVWFCFHDGDEPEMVAADFLEFVASRGLKC
jgi:antitoxin YobK